MDLKEPGCERSLSAKSIPTAEPYCENTGQMSPVTTTSQLSLWDNSPLISTSSVAASPARTSRPPARAQALPASAADYGNTTPELLGKFDPATRSLKTSQLCFLEGSETFSATFPRSGMMRNGTVFQLPPLVRLTDATGSGLWRTPNSRENGGGEYQDTEKIAIRWANGRQVNLSEQAKMWPTPTSRDWKDGSAQACANVPSNSLLGREVHTDGMNSSGSLNPAWVEFLMGLPTGWTALKRSATPSSRRSRS